MKFSKTIFLSKIRTKKIIRYFQSGNERLKMGQLRTGRIQLYNLRMLTRNLFKKKLFIIFFFAKTIKCFRKKIFLTNQKITKIFWSTMI